jgi:hypothetical protein
MILEGQSGPQAIQDGSVNTVRLTKDSSAGAQDTHARYQEAVYRGNVFSAANTAAVTIGVLTATGVTFHLYNPAASGKNLVVLTVSFAPSSATFVVSPVWLVVNAQATAPTGTTALVVRNNLLGAGAAAVGQVFSAATLAAVPVPVRPFFTVPATALTSLFVCKDEVAGEIIVGPGQVLSVQGNVAATAVGFLAASWEEIPV